MADLIIERVGEKGDGMCEGRAYPRTLPGEHIKINGEVVHPSTERVAPFCPVFDTCGSCKLQHWQEVPYQKWKSGLLAAALDARKLNPEIQPLLDAHGHGRRRVSLHVRQVENRWRAGFMAEGSHTLVPIDECPVLSRALKSAPEIAAKFGPFFGACDVAITATDHGLDVAIKAERKLADKAVAQFDGLMSANNILRIAVNGETRAQLAPPLVQMSQAVVTLPVGSFLQATKKGEEIISDLIGASAKKSKRVLDLFCGVGPFTFALSHKHTIHAVDSDKAAIAAVQFAIRNTQGLKPITTEVRDLFRNPLTPMELNEYDLVVLDPPRAGAEAQCASLAKSKVKRVTYVSCDVQTFARDAATLCLGGYKLHTVTPVDQFKYSAHLEIVATLSRS